MAVLVEAGGMLALVLAFMVASGLALVYRESFAKAIIGLADALDGISFGALGHRLKPFGYFAAWLRWLDRSMEGLLGAAVNLTERGVVFLWHGLTVQVQVLGRLLGDLADTIEHRFHRLLLLFPPAAILWATVRAVQELPRLWDDLHRAAHKAAAAYEAVVGEHSWVRGKFRTAERERVNLAKRIKAQARHFTKAGAAVLVGTALATLGLGWLRCNRVGKVGKRGFHLGALQIF